jgi:hypothetical protein
MAISWSSTAKEEVGFDGKLSDAKIEEAGVDHFDPITRAANV